MYFVLYELTCASKKVKDRWSTKMSSTSSLVKRRCATQVRWSKEDVLHKFVGQTKMCCTSSLVNEDLQLIFVDMAQRRCVPHLRWSNEQVFIGNLVKDSQVNEDQELIFVCPTKMWDTSSLSQGNEDHTSVDLVNADQINVRPTKMWDTSSLIHINEDQLLIFV